MGGWDTRLPMDTRTITPELFTQAFPAGVDLVMASPPLAASTPPTGNPGTKAISPSHGRPDKILDPTPSCEPGGRNRIYLGHPHLIPSPRTRPTNYGTVYSPKRP